MELIKYLNNIKERDSVYAYAIRKSGSERADIEIDMRDIKETNGNLHYIGTLYNDSLYINLYKQVEIVVEQGEHQGWNDNDEPIITTTVLRSFIEISMEINRKILRKEYNMRNIFNAEKEKEKATMLAFKTRAASQDKLQKQLNETIISDKEIKEMSILPMGIEGKNE